MLQLIRRDTINSAANPIKRGGGRRGHLRGPAAGRPGRAPAPRPGPGPGPPPRGRRRLTVSLPVGCCRPGNPAAPAVRPASGTAGRCHGADETGSHRPGQQQAESRVPPRLTDCSPPTGWPCPTSAQQRAWRAQQSAVAFFWTQTDRRQRLDRRAASRPAAGGGAPSRAFTAGRGSDTSRTAAGPAPAPDRSTIAMAGPDRTGRL